MRKGFLGSIAALAAGAGAAWGEPPAGPGGAPVGLPAALPGSVEAGPIAPAPPIGGPPQFGGFPRTAVPGNAGFAPAPAVMPPGNFGPPYDPLGMGPAGGFGPPPGPMYPVPGPYAEQLYQPAPAGPSGLDGGGPGGLGYGNAPHWWVEGEYLLWFTRGQNVRFPLLTSSAPSDAGLLGAASTTVLVGDRPLGYNAMNGLRIGTGFFGDADRRYGFQMYGFVVERASNTQTFGRLDNDVGILPLGVAPGFTNPTPLGALQTLPLTRQSGIPTLARPFIDSTTGLQSTVVLSDPNFGPAKVVVGTSTQTWGITPEGVLNLYRTQPGCRNAWSIDLTAGYRYLYVKEDLWIYSRTELNGFNNSLQEFRTGPFGIIFPVGTGGGLATTNFGGVNVTVPATIDLRDRFTAINQFNGFVLGLKTDARYGMVTTSAFAKIAIGEMHEKVNVAGTGSFFDPTGVSGSVPNTAAAFAPGGGIGAAYGGVLANAGNIGTYIHDRFTYIPEFGGNIGIALTRGLTGYIGGNFLYFPNLVRPGNLVNPVTSAVAIPFSSSYGQAGAPRGPAFQIVESDHWIGGVNAGLILKY